MAIIKLKDKETIDIENSRAKVLKEQWVSGELPSVIEIGYRAFARTKIDEIILDEDIQKKYDPKFTDEEMEEFEKEIEPFKNEREVEGEKIKIFDTKAEDAYLKAKGIVGKMHIIKEMIPMHQDFEKKLRAYFWWKGKKQFVERKEVERLADMNNAIKEQKEFYTKKFGEEMANEIDEIIPSEIPF